MSHLANQLVIAERAEVARGIRLLLATPLISERAAPEAFDLIRRRREPIRQWFDFYCGWTLTVEPRLGYARLAKVRMATDPSRPARRLRSGRAPFDRRRYVLLCVTAAELLTVPVTTIGLLASRVTSATNADEVVTTFDTASRMERMAFVDVLRLLESFGVLDVVDGTTETFVDSASAKVLYQVDATLLLRLLAAPVGPSQPEIPIEEVPLRFEQVLTGISRERRYGSLESTEVQRTLWLRHSVFRRLVDDPVLYFADLSPDELGYITSLTGKRLVHQAAELSGFTVEERTEGIMFVDADGVATDTRFPDDAGTAKVAALLLLDNIDGPVTVEQLHRDAIDVLNRFPKWARTYRGDDGPGQLVTDALAVLTGFGLVEITSTLVHPLPAAARYAVGTARVKDA